MVSRVNQGPPKKVVNYTGPSKIEDFLYLGNEIDAVNTRLLIELNIKNIVQLVPLSPPPEAEERFRYLKIPIRGGKNTDIRPVLVQSLNFIHRAVSAGENVLVHCKHGKNRSASIVVAYIMATKLIRSQQAIQAVSGIRPMIKLKDRTVKMLNEMGPVGLRMMIEGLV